MSTTKPRILVIDDSTEDLIQINADLQPGFETHGVNYGDAAFEHLESSPRLPDLILLDVNMPGMSGLEVLAGLKMDPRWSDIPIILMTTSAGSDEEQGLDLGASDWMQKPIPKGAVAVRVRHQLRLRKQRLRAQEMAKKDHKAESFAIHNLAHNVTANIAKLESNWQHFVNIFGNNPEVCSPAMCESMTQLLNDTRADLTRIVRITEGVDGF